MDGKRYKNLKKYFCIYIAFSLLFTAVLYAQASYGRTLEHRRMLTLMAAHPEWEAELIVLWNKPADEGGDQKTGTEGLEIAVRTAEEKYGYDLHKVAPERQFYFFWGLGMVFGGILALGLMQWERYRRRKGLDFDETYGKVCECLEQFRGGNFRQPIEYDDRSEEWMNLWENLRELGIYFEGLKERLKEEEESTKALITDISHQLKTPLASLRMSHELVTADHVTEEEREEFQRQEAKEIEKLEMLLAELVNLSRLEKRMIQIKPIPASLKETITDAVSQVYMKARKKEIEIQVKMDGDMEICHDRKWTAEAITNVLDNAVKYSGRNTMITVCVQHLVNYVLIEVEDEGFGISTEELVKIYQRFYRGDEAREKVKEGSGVGLYLARMILEQQGGTISAKRRPKQGTVFKITLPG